MCSVTLEWEVDVTSWQMKLFQPLAFHEPSSTFIGYMQSLSDKLADVR